MRQGDTRKDHRELVRPRGLVEVEPVFSLARVRWKSEILPALDLVVFHTERSVRFRGQKRRGRILVAWTDYVEVTILARRKMKLEFLTGGHRQSIAGPHSIGFVGSVDLQPVATNFMPTSSQVGAIRPIR